MTLTCSSAGGLFSGSGGAVLIGLMVQFWVEVTRGRVRAVPGSIDPAGKEVPLLHSALIKSLSTGRHALQQVARGEAQFALAGQQLHLVDDLRHADLVGETQWPAAE